MINKYRLFLISKNNKELLLYSLLIVLMGIFLLPRVAFLSSVTEENIIKLTNEERLKSDLTLLTANQALAKAALNKGEEILATGKFQHNIGDRKFSAWIKEAGYKYSYAGENLAIDFITSEGAMRAWLNSPTHKKNILSSKFSEIGVAVINGKFQGSNTTLIVQVFGAPLSPLAQTSKAGSKAITQAPLPQNVGLTPGYMSTNNLITGSGNYSTLGIAPTPEQSTQKTGWSDPLGTGPIISRVELFYLKNTGVFKLVVTGMIFVIFLFLADYLSGMPQVRNFFTTKNKQLKLPLR